VTSNIYLNQADKGFEISHIDDILGISRKQSGGSPKDEATGVIAFLVKQLLE
jgi:hypothetical protein